MTWPRLDHNADTGFLCNRHRISRHRISDFFSATLYWQISYTMPDGLPPTTERLENVNFQQFLLLGNLGFIHIFEGWQNPSESDGAYLSLSVLKITKSGNNLFTSVNLRSPHCLEQWWPGGTRTELLVAQKVPKEMTKKRRQLLSTSSLHNTIFFFYSFLFDLFVSPTCSFEN